MKPYGYVYLTINTLTGARYVGQRRGAFQSWYKGSGVVIKRAVAKHGDEAFSVERIQSARDQKELDELETLYIRELRELYPAALVYNIRDGGLGSNFGGYSLMKGKTHSKETRAKMSASHSGENNFYFGKGHLLSGKNNPRFGARLSEETKATIAAKNRLTRGEDHGNFGKIRSPETRAKISKGKMGQVSRKGWKMTDEQKAKISASRKAKFADGFKMEYSEETRRKISEGRKRFWANRREFLQSR